MSNIKRVTQTGPERRAIFINLDTVWHLQRGVRDDYTMVKFSDEHSINILEPPETVFKLAQEG